MLVVVDDEDRENEGDLLMAADKVDAGGGQLHGQARPRPDLHAHDRRSAWTSSQIALMVRDNTGRSAPPSPSPWTPAAASTTGIVRLDRAITIRTLVDPAARPDDLDRPGHIFPLRAMPGGVLRRAGHTEAAVDLARLAGSARRRA